MEDWEIRILHWKELTEEKMIKKRKNYNPDYPFSRVMQCPICWKHLTPNKSRSKTWRYYHYYQCNWKPSARHKNYKVDQNELNSIVANYIKSIKPDQKIVDCYNDILDYMLEIREKEIKETSDRKTAEIINLKRKHRTVLDNIDKYSEYPEILESKNKELEDMKIEITYLENNFWNDKNTFNKEEFKQISNIAITHLDKLAMKREKPELIQLVFWMIFEDKPTYEEIKSHTPKLFPLFSSESQTK